jgi:hydrogenase/urease accessory protein HupE
MMTWWIRVAGLVYLIAASDSFAHEIRPAYLQIEETSPLVYDVLWKVPSRGDRVLDIQPRFDDALSVSEAGAHTAMDGFVVYRYRVSGDTGLAGTKLRIYNLQQTTVDALVTINFLDGARHSFLLQPRSHSAVIPQAPSAWNVIITYTRLGVEHILLGIDHLLFVISLMLIVSGVPTLVKTITAFTVAHSITLTLVVLGYLTLPPRPVEVLIALSIVLVCVEAVRKRDGGSSLAIEWPWLVAFVFGLLHGFGFAGALLDLGLPQGDTPLALLFFNIGVEIGQLIFIIAILTATVLTGRLITVPRVAPVALSYVIGSIGAFWVFERVYTTFL